ncbi:MAG: sulfatase-like hydrolase/transferase [Candidatus Omnitrophica bacterium]|nr:sulfatase-like hydrolase/transferase [Candidatus Omnitrophota bacterium]MCM8801963.1 sulfatase-like hydrolase/transferase [Candidatus Omnitrophota bacterium]
MEKKDIIIFMPDQLRSDCIGAYGNKIIKTPNIDKIAEEGVVFKNAYTVSPLCMPARASFVSGLYPHQHGIWKNKGALPAEDETFFHHLQKNGWFVGYIGKSHFYEHKNFHMKIMEDYMRKRGIDYVHETTGPHATVKTDSYMTDYLKEKGLLEIFRDDYRKRNKFSTHPSPLSEEDYLDSYVGKKVCEFLKEYCFEKPLCLFVGFPSPHEPWDPPGRFSKMYSPDDMPEEIKDKKLDEKLPEKTKKIIEKNRKSFEGLTSEIIKKIRACYYGKISLVDYWIGEILKIYYEKREPDQLIIIFWSDHGEMLGDHYLLYKSVFYEQSVKVPLIIKWPGKNDYLRKNSEKIVEIIDVFPTLLYGLGIKKSEREVGENLFEEKKKNFALSEIYAFDMFQYMIRTENYKGIFDKEKDCLFLFDLKNDPYETKNLAGKEKLLEKNLLEILYMYVLNSK